MKDGYRLTTDENHNVVEVQDVPSVAPNKPSAANSEPVVQPEKPAKAAACSMAPRGENPTGIFVLAAALGLTLLSRRRMTSRASG